MHMEADILSPEEKRRLVEATTEISSLGHQVDQLQRTLREQLEELSRSGKQLDDKITGIEKACSGLAEMSQELEALKGFKDGVEQLHTRLRQALNGSPETTRMPHGSPRLGLPHRD